MPLLNFVLLFPLNVYYLRLFDDVPLRPLDYVPSTCQLPYSPHWFWLKRHEWSRHAAEGPKYFVLLCRVFVSRSRSKIIFSVRDCKGPWYHSNHACHAHATSVFAWFRWAHAKMISPSRSAPRSTAAPDLTSLSFGPWVSAGTPAQNAWRICKSKSVTPRSPQCSFFQGHSWRRRRRVAIPRSTPIPHRVARARSVMLTDILIPPWPRIPSSNAAQDGKR